MLQDHSYNHGKAHGRFYEDRNVKHTKKLGEQISIWGSRCIVCTRCVRFCNEISGAGELTVVNRGDHSVIDIFPGRPLDNGLSMCTEDVCPVGALISEDFKFKARVWFTKSRKTVCASCSLGCNVDADTMGETIVRLKPRANAAVNDWWMCDHGRLSWKLQASPERIVSPKVDGKPASRAEAVKAAYDRLAAAGSGAAGIVSLWNTSEEMFLFRRLLKVVNPAALLGTLEKPSVAPVKFRAFEIEGDRNPNRAGAKIVLGPAADGGTAEIVKGIRTGKITALLVVNASPQFAMPPGLEEVLPSLKTLIVADVLPSPLAGKAHVLLPAAMHWEQDGTYVNVDGRVQRARQVLVPPGDAAPSLEFLQEMLNRHPPGGLGLLSGDGVFRQLGAEFAQFRELTYREIGDQGIPVRPAVQ